MEEFADDCSLKFLAFEMQTLSVDPSHKNNVLIHNIINEIHQERKKELQDNMVLNDPDVSSHAEVRIPSKLTSVLRGPQKLTKRIFKRVSFVFPEDCFDCPPSDLESCVAKSSSSLG